jgi:hypothetical protein
MKLNIQSDTDIIVHVEILIQNTTIDHFSTAEECVDELTYFFK